MWRKYLMPISAPLHMQSAHIHTHVYPDTHVQTHDTYVYAYHTLTQKVFVFKEKKKEWGRTSRVMWDGTSWSMLETASLTDQQWLSLVFAYTRLQQDVSLSQDQPQRHKRSGLKGNYIQHPGSFEKASYLVLETRVHPFWSLWWSIFARGSPLADGALARSSVLASLFTPQICLCSLLICVARLPILHLKHWSVSYRGCITICISLTYIIHLIERTGFQMAERRKDSLPISHSQGAVLYCSLLMLDPSEMCPVLNGEKSALLCLSVHKTILQLF